MTFAPLDAEYLTLAANGVLTDYRILTLGSMLVAVDGGPTGPYTLNVDPTAIDHGDLDQLTTGDPHPQYMLGTILSADGDILTRVAGSPANLSIGSDGEVLTAASGLPTWAAPAARYQLLDSQPTEQVWNNTAAQQTAYTFTIPASTLASGDLMRLRLFFDMLNNTGATRTITWQISLGGTTIYQDTTASIAAAATRRSTFLDLEFAIRGQNPNVRLNGVYSPGHQSAPATGIGNLSNSNNFFTFDGDANLTLSNNLTLLVQFTFSTNNTNLELRLRGATLEHISA